MSKKNRLLILRIVSVILLIAIAVTIFSFSAQDRKKSSKKSAGVTRKLCEEFYPKFKEKPKPVQNKIVKKAHNPVRKAAHVTLYFAFGMFAFLSIISYTKLKLFLRVFSASALSVMYAASDEFHQAFVKGRGPQVTDVLIDSIGIFLAVIILYFIFKNKRIRAFFGMEGK